MSPEERRYIEVMLTLRAFSPELYEQVCMALSLLRDHYRDRAMGAGADSTMFLAVGFARGVNEITRLTTDAPALHLKLTGSG